MESCYDNQLYIMTAWNIPKLTFGHDLAPQTIFIRNDAYAEMLSNRRGGGGGGKWVDRGQGRVAQLQTKWVPDTNRKGLRTDSSIRVGAKSWPKCSLSTYQGSPYAIWRGRIVGVKRPSILFELVSFELTSFELAFNPMKLFHACNPLKLKNAAGRIQQCKNLHPKLHPIKHTLQRGSWILRTPRLQKNSS